ncbi:MAG: cell division ATP-binding protein FtsE [Hyphomicrobiales bacterium]
MIRFENVSLRYGTGSEVLNDVSFDLAPGSFTFLTGPSGAGKSSLLRLIFLAIRPTRGFITIAGEDPAVLDRDQLVALRRRMGVVFQDFRLLDHLTAFENVALPLIVRGETVDAIRDDVNELMAWVGLAKSADVYPPVLSGGEKQRVAIARAIIGKPDIILADEPTGNVDPALADRLLKLFVELNRLGTTVLIATHDQHLFASGKAPVLHLEKGRLKERVFA